MSEPIMGMIQSGQFGVNQPYNPYAAQNNMVPIFPPQQQQQYTNPYQPNMGAYQQPNNGYVFQPLPQQQFMNPPEPYGYQPQGMQYVGNLYGQQQQYDYYNPYGSQQYPNQYSGYNGYYGYRPFYSPMQVQLYQQQQVQLMKMKFRMANKFFGKETNEEELDKMLNPDNKQNQMTREEAERLQEYKFMQYCHQTAEQPYQIESEAQIKGRMICEMSRNLHEALDNHSLHEFLENDLWKLQREEWIRKNIKRGATRDLSQVYSSRDYNELLNMHRSSNPYVNELLDNARYDNNVDDVELGMNLAFDAERRRLDILNGKIPSFITSDENQKRRQAFTQGIIDSIYKKGGSLPNV